MIAFEKRKACIEVSAFCLHARPYRESSLIVQFFSEQAGRVSAVVKGVKGGSKKNGMLLPLLQPFIPLRIALSGKSELKTLVSAELNGQPSLLKGQALFAGLYVNELLVRLLPEHIEYPEIYQHYQNVLETLQRTEFLEPPLRQFERYLLENLGYGVPFVEVDAAGRSVGSLQATEHYRFVPESGFVCCRQNPVTKNQMVFHGECLLQIANDDLNSPEVVLQAKQLMRIVMAQRLGNKPLNSKLLFI